MKTQSVDTLIIGAGVIGSSVALHLTALGVHSVVVIDPDLEGTWSSSELNAGGVRATWSQPTNIRLSKLSIDYFASVAREVGYRPCGYLWLHRPERFEAALKAREQQMSLGWPVEAWSVDQLRKAVPFLDKTEDLGGAIFAPKDGLINPNLLKNHYRERARAGGAHFEDRTCLHSAKRASGATSSSLWEVEARVYLPADRSLQESEVSSRMSKSAGDVAAKLLGIQKEDVSQLHFETKTFHAKRVINCAGAWAAEVAKRLGYECPSKPVRRQISLFDCREVDLNQYGMIVDSSGVYFHPEASYGLAGFANAGEPSGVNLQYDGESFFNESIWPALYERSTHFERLRHLQGWAGLYEVSPDESAIIGAVTDRSGLYEAHSFSGHGVMHSYAAGLALAELVTHGAYRSIDLTALSAQRFIEGRSIHEGWVI